MALNPALRGLTEEVNSRFVFAGLALVVSLMLALQFQAFDSIQGSGEIEVNVSVQKPSENISHQVRLQNGSTAFTALNRSFDTEYSESSMGYFITGIDGLSSNSTHYWMYFVNGESPQVGAGQYRLGERDDVVFRYLSLNESQEYVE